MPVLDEMANTFHSSFFLFCVFQDDRPTDCVNRPSVIYHWEEISIDIDLLEQRNLVMIIKLPELKWPRYGEWVVKVVNTSTPPTPPPQKKLEKLMINAVIRRWIERKICHSIAIDTNDDRWRGGDKEDTQLGRLGSDNGSILQKQVKKREIKIWAGNWPEVFVSRHKPFSRTLSSPVQSWLTSETSTQAYLSPFELLFIYNDWTRLDWPNELVISISCLFSILISFDVHSSSYRLQGLDWLDWVVERGLSCLISAMRLSNQSQNDLF